MSSTLGERQLEEFASKRAGLIESAPWLFPLRESAHAAARALGMPGARDEPWRFVDLRELSAGEWPLLSEPTGADLSFAESRLEGMDAIRLVFVDGRLDEARSSIGELPAGVTIGGMRESFGAASDLLQPRLAKLATFDANYFTALNTALFQDGCLVHLAAGVRLERPIHLRWLRATPRSSWNPRLMIALEEGAAAELLEEHRSGGEGLSNSVVEIDLASDARLTHSRIVREHAAGSHLATIGGSIGRGAHYRGFSVVAGGRLVRNEYDLRLVAEDAFAELDGLVAASGQETVDHHTRIEHAAPSTRSREHFRHVLDGAAHGVFCGRVDVAPEAQKTDAEQQNRNLLLSERARMNTMPQLMIHADDVRCSHGATLGQLDDDALFYLRSRGLGHEEARRLLVHAFVSEMVERLPFTVLQDELRDWLGVEVLA